MNKLLALFLTTSIANANSVTCVQTTGLTTCSNGMTAYSLGNMQQYNMPNGNNLTIWNSNINRYQDVQVQPVIPYPIAPIQGLDNLGPMFKPLD